MNELKVIQKTVHKKKKTIFYNNNEIVISLSYDLNGFIESNKEILLNKYIIEEKNRNVMIAVNNYDDFKRLLVLLSMLSRIKRKDTQTKSIILAYNISNEDIDYWYNKITNAYKERRLIGTFRIIRALKVMLGIER